MNPSLHTITKTLLYELNSICNECISRLMGLRRSCLCSFGLFAHLVKNMKTNGRTQREKKGRKKKGRGHEKHLM
jgi:hypothetical protein